MSTEQNKKLLPFSLSVCIDRPCCVSIKLNGHACMHIFYTLLPCCDFSAQRSWSPTHLYYMYTWRNSIVAHISRVLRLRALGTVDDDQGRIIHHRRIKKKKECRRKRVEMKGRKKWLGKRDKNRGRESKLSLSTTNTLSRCHPLISHHSLRSLRRHSMSSSNCVV